MKGVTPESALQLLPELPEADGPFRAEPVRQSHLPFSVIKWFLAAMALLILTGCPAQTRLYVQNQSTESLIYAGGWKPDDPITIKAGRTAWVPIRSGQDDCVELSANGRKRGYVVDINAQMHGEATRYGSRINAIYRDGQLSVLGESGVLVDLQVRDGCAGYK